MALTISSVSNQYSLRIPAHRFQQGGRDVYYFALDLPTLDGLLPQRVDDSVVKDANRRLTPGHAKSIQMYLDEKDDWLLGALMLGIAPDAVEFEPYPSEEGENTDFGQLRILTNRANTMKIFDGQHRRRAIQDALAELAGNGQRKDKSDELRKASMSIVLYAEDNTQTLRQMFVDASQNKRIEPHTTTRFDQRDPFNMAAVWLSEKSRLFRGRVEMERSSVPRSSQSLVAINQLATVLKTLKVGYSRRVSKAMNDEYMLDLDSLYRQCRAWSDEFLPAARYEYGGIISGEIDDSDIPGIRATTFAYNGTFIRILAACYWSWIREHDSWDPLAEFIRKAAIRHGSKYGLLVDAGLTDPSGTKIFSRRQEVARAIDYIVDAAMSEIG